MKYLPLIIFFILSISKLKAQKENIESWKDKISLSGYTRYMNSTSVINLDSTISDNLIHNRLKFKLNFNNELTGVVEIRNRIFFGKATNLNPFLGQVLDNDIGNIDLSFIPYNSQKLVMHSIFDRAYLKYTSEKWELRIGRQRINWGVNLAWNPNDLFNAYSLIDFDYQERAGADAFRFQYFTGDMSSLEFAIQPGDNIDESIFAGLWKFNLAGNDFQLLAGNYYSDTAIGIGWAGNIKKSGFTIESTYFTPKKDLIDSSDVLSSSISMDYSTKKGIYFNVSVLYNSQGNDKKTSSENLFGTFLGDISAKNLMPSKFTYYSQINGSFTPAVNGSFSFFYMKEDQMLLIMPSLSYELIENIDSMLLGQFTYNELDTRTNFMGVGIFARLSYNF